MPTAGLLRLDDEPKIHSESVRERVVQLSGVGSSWIRWHPARRFSPRHGETVRGLARRASQELVARHARLLGEGMDSLHEREDRHEEGVLAFLVFDVNEVHEARRRRRGKALLRGEQQQRQEQPQPQPQPQ